MNHISKRGQVASWLKVGILKENAINTTFIRGVVWMSCPL